MPTLERHAPLALDRRRLALSARRGAGFLRRSAALGLCLGAGVLVWVAYSVMVDVQAGNVPQGHLVTLVIGVALWLYGACAAVFGEVRRVREVVLEPERRVVDALRAMRNGDLSFRLHLGRHEVLQDVAGELNALLDWLNSSPPTGSRVGGDILHLEDDVAEDDVGAGDVPPDIPRIVCADPAVPELESAACP